MTRTTRAWSTSPTPVRPVKEDPLDRRIFRAGGSRRPYVTSDGRIFKMVLNEEDPTVVDELSIVARWPAAVQLPNPTPPTLPASSVTSTRFVPNPDNLDVGANSLMVQEDAIEREDLALRPRATGTWSHRWPI